MKYCYTAKAEALNAPTLIAFAKGTAMISANALPILLFALALAFVVVGVAFGCALSKLAARVKELEARSV